MENTSGLKPLGRAILIKPYTPERKAGVIIIPDNVNDRITMLDQRAVIVELGEFCYPDEPARCAPGDKVLVANLSGYNAVGPADGERYRMVNDRDVFAQITKEKENE